jgi:DNA-binding transcriptional ArsR family regulator
MNIHSVEYLQSMIQTFRALADPARLQIVELLLRESLPVGVVAERLGIRQPQASKHLRLLMETGLVVVRPDAQRRIYTLRAEAFQDIDAWLQRYRKLWEEQFERLDEVLDEMRAGKKRRLTRRPR